MTVPIYAKRRIHHKYGLSLIALLAVGGLSSNAYAACDIADTDLQSGQTANCTGNFTQETYHPTGPAANVTINTGGTWNYSGALPNGSSIIGPIASSDLENATFVNTAAITWNNAEGVNIQASVFGYWSSPDTIKNPTYINNGNITAVAADSAFRTFNGIGIGGFGTTTAENSGSIQIDATAITTTDTLVNGIYALGSDNSVLSNSGVIDISGGVNQSTGIYYQANSGNYSTGSHNVDIKNTNQISVNTAGTSSGILVVDTIVDNSSLGNATIANEGTIEAINSASGQSTGILFSTDSAAASTSIVNNGTIVASSQGTLAFGIWAISPNSAAVEITNSGTITSSHYAIGINSDTQANITNSGQLTGNVAAFDGTQTYTQTAGFLAGELSLGAGNDTAVFSGGDLSKTTLFDGGGDANGSDGEDTLTFAGVAADLKGAAIVNWEKINVDAAQINLTDNALIVGSLDGYGLTLTNGGSVNVGSNFDLTGNLSLSNGGIFGTTATEAGMIAVNGNVSNGGVINLANGVAGTRLSVDGNYAGNGGTLLLNTVLGDDASTTDMLVITGNASGTTNVGVVNVGGTGAQTVEGIKIIEVGGVSEGTFSLLSDYEHNGEKAVVAGAYAYKLYQGGVSTPTDGDWYLRSQVKPVDPIEPTNPTDPVDPQPEQPLYQAGVPTYESYVQSLLGLNGVSTLQQRVGNRLWTGNGNRVIAQGADPVGTPYAAPEEAGVAIEGNGVWGRIEGAHNKIEPRFSTSSTDYDQNILKLQAGLDGLLLENEGGKLIGGVTVHYAHGKTETQSVHGDGEIATDGYGFGGTLTWYGENGFYLDGQAQVTWYDSDLSSTLANTTLADGNDGFGYALSVEGGKRIAIDQAWSLTPQAQLVYSSVDFDDFTDTFGSRISLDRGDSLQGRLGLTLDHENSWQNANGQLDRAHVYGIANLYYEFLEGTKVDVAGVSFASEQDRLWGGLGIGGSYNWNDDKYSIYGEGLINTSLNNFGDSYSVKGQAGFKVKW
ncbi:autotransporter outer membrane beta-barrel domain-containing protein [Brucellaceae bacterium D45D]